MWLTSREIRNPGRTTSQKVFKQKLQETAILILPLGHLKSQTKLFKAPGNFSTLLRWPTDGPSELENKLSVHEQERDCKIKENIVSDSTGKHCDIWIAKPIL